MPKILIIADDLTGACDAAARSRASGLSASVALAWESDGIRNLDTTVVAVSTESRHEDSQVAKARTRKAVELAKETGVSIVYKKTDSTLRGNISCEIDAALEAWGSEVCFYVPAVPNSGRTVMDGKLSLNGRPLESSSFAYDPKNPVVGGDLREMLGGQIQRDVCIVSLDTLRSRNLPSYFGDGIWIFDGETEADLGLVAGLAKNHLNSVFAGPAGFAFYFRKLLGLPEEVVNCSEAAGPLVAVCGSLNPVSMEQVHRALESGFMGIRLGPVILSQWQDGDRDGVLNYLAEHYDQLGLKPLVFYTASGEMDRREFKDSPLFRGRSEREVSALVEEVFEEVGRLLADGSGWNTLVLLGGDTARRTLDGLDCREIRIRDEHETGIAEGSIRLGKSEKTVYLKSGGFGLRDFLPSLRCKCDDSKK